MRPSLDLDQVTRAYRIALSTLLAERTSEGIWLGELSASALSTATAVSALALVQENSAAQGPHADLITRGLAWLMDHQNADGGWGDTVKSISNISTSMLCRAAFHIAGVAEHNIDCLHKAEKYLQDHCGKTSEEQAEAVRTRYGKDRTFAVPILMTCALAGLVSWKEVKPLPFELACFPQAWFPFLRLPVVSYALPALIAVGQAVYHHRPPRNPIIHLIRSLSLRKSLRLLEAIQPSSGGYLEAIPLTSFVTLSLASIGLAEHPVARRGAEFLANSVRPDGSWAIDSNLSVWVTTLSANALAAAGELEELDKLPELRDWLLQQQFKDRHPYTGASPGGWGWTHLPGSVPDGDDTPGALLALSNWFVRITPETLKDPAVRPMLNGLVWLLDLKNRDGGWPTFCKGWGHLPFDRSGCDLTAHVLRSFKAWQVRLLPSGEVPKYPETTPHDPCDEDFIEYWLGLAYLPVNWALTGGLRYLARQQRPDGSWLPLWFGNQHAPNDENPTYGTAHVLAAYRDLDKMNSEPARRGIAWLLSAQNADGGWGGAAGVPSSMEETALAAEVLLDAGEEAESAVNKGLAWLVQQVEAGGLENPTPIGFYFAKLWYFEKLYPIIFTVAALGRALKKLSHRCEPARPPDIP